MFRSRSAFGGLVFLVCICFTLMALGEGTVQWVDPPGAIRPGKAIRLNFSVSLAGDADILLKNESGELIAIVEEDFPAKAGRNNLTWDGKTEGSPLPSGTYVLQVVQGTKESSAKVTIGDVSPVILSVMPSDAYLIPGTDWYLSVETNMEATLTVKIIQDSGDIILYEALLPAGSHEIPWDGKADGQPLSPGSYNIGVNLKDGTGFSSNGEQLTITVEEPSAATVQPTDTAPALMPTPAPTGTHTAPIVQNSSNEDVNSPADFSNYTCSHESCFFTLPMGVMDEAAIWNAMMQPMTVVKGEQRQVVKVYAEPNKDSKAVGEVTCDSQGLHVLETLDNGWTLVEAYSSSIHSSKIKNWAGFFSGYIETSKLETKQPNQKYGLLLDKLTQRMYVFQEGKIIGELLISTGLVNSKQPYNETPAGEFMVVSRTGGFWSGNLWCDLALRVNGGILIHEVPCLKSEDDVRDYGPFERVLGQKASHGCIRVQKELSPEGINMRWLWDNIKLNTRVFIWDDVGRNIPIPEDSLPLYYNPDGGQYYHSDQNCSSVKNKYLPLTGFTYGELESSPYDRLTPCSSCNPPKRKAEIESLNEGNK
jgi:flagellar hook assembly protein FlgD